MKYTKSKFLKFVFSLYLISCAKTPKKLDKVQNSDLVPYIEAFIQDSCIPKMQDKSHIITIELIEKKEETEVYFIKNTPKHYRSTLHKSNISGFDVFFIAPKIFKSNMQIPKMFNGFEYIVIVQHDTISKIITDCKTYRSRITLGPITND